MNNRTPISLIIRQRPAFGDALLLGPLIRKIKQANPSHEIQVLTDSAYASGAMVDIFRGVPHVDKVFTVPQTEWTTESNRRVDWSVSKSDVSPIQVRKANKIYDCNGAFIEFERQYNGNPPYGIAEFWLRHFDFITIPTVEDLLPYYKIAPEYQTEGEKWITDRNLGKYVCLVLNAGDKVRNWDHNDIAYRLIDYFYTKGINVVTIDPIQKLEDERAYAAIGLRLPTIAQILKSSMFTISPDTGILHLAQAVGNPTVAIWGIMRPELRILGYNSVLCPNPPLGICEEGETCHCWQFQRWSCLRRIKLNHVVNAIEERLQSLCQS